MDGRERARLRRIGPKEPRMCRGNCGNKPRSIFAWYCDDCNQKRPGFGSICCKCKAAPSRSPTDSYCVKCDNKRDRQI